MSLAALAALFAEPRFLPRGEPPVAAALRVVPELLDGLPPLRVRADGGVETTAALDVPLPGPEVLHAAGRGGGPELDAFVLRLAEAISAGAALSPAAATLPVLAVAGATARAVAARAGEMDAGAQPIADGMRSAVAAALVRVGVGGGAAPRLAGAVAASPLVFRHAYGRLDVRQTMPALLGAIGSKADAARVNDALEATARALAGVRGRIQRGEPRPEDVPVVTVGAASLGEDAVDPYSLPPVLVAVVLPWLSRLLDGAPPPPGLEDPSQGIAMASIVGDLGRQLARWEVLARVVATVRPAEEGRGRWAAVIDLGEFRARREGRGPLEAAVRGAARPGVTVVDIGARVLLVGAHPEPLLAAMAAVARTVGGVPGGAITYGDIAWRGDGERWHVWGEALDRALELVPEGAAQAGVMVDADAADELRRLGRAGEEEDAIAFPSVVARGMSAGPIDTGWLLTGLDPQFVPPPPEADHDGIARVDMPEGARHGAELPTVEPPRPARAAAPAADADEGSLEAVFGHGAEAPADPFAAATPPAATPPAAPAVPAAPTAADPFAAPPAAAAAADPFAAPAATPPADPFAAPAADPFAVAPEAAPPRPAVDPFAVPVAATPADPFGATVAPPTAFGGEAFGGAPEGGPLAAGPAGSDPFADALPPPPPVAAAPPARKAPPAPVAPSAPPVDDDPFALPPPAAPVAAPVAAAPPAAPVAAPPVAAAPVAAAAPEDSFFLPGVGARAPAGPQMELVDDEDDVIAPSNAAPIAPARLGPLPKVDIASILRGYVVFADRGDLVFGRPYGKRVIDEHRYAGDRRDAAFRGFLQDKIQEGFVPRTDLVGDIPAGAEPKPLDPADLQRAWDTLS